MNALNIVLMMRKEQGIRIKEQISPVVHILAAAVKTWVEFHQQVLQTSQESHFEEAVGIGSIFGLSCQCDEKPELEYQKGCQ